MTKLRIFDWKAKVHVYYCNVPKSVAYKPIDTQKQIERVEEESDKFKESLSKWGIRQRKTIEAEIITRMREREDLDNKPSLCVKVIDSGWKVSEEIMEGEEESTTGVTYRILRMAARGPKHTYGLTKPEFYKRMSERREHYTVEQSKQLLQLFKDELVITKAKI